MNPIKSRKHLRDTVKEVMDGVIAGCKENEEDPEEYMRFILQSLVKKLDYDDNEMDNFFERLRGNSNRVAVYDNIIGMSVIGACETLQRYIEEKSIRENLPALREGGISGCKGSGCRPPSQRGSIPDNSVPIKPGHRPQNPPLGSVREKICPLSGSTTTSPSPENRK